jgi:Xaa-Pro aminopeptidase
MDVVEVAKRTNRLPALQAAMEEEGVDLVVVGPTANLRYLLGYRALSVDRLTTLLVSRDAAVMVLPDFDEAEFVAATGLGETAPWPDRFGPEDAVTRALGRMAVGPDPRTLVDDELPFGFLMEFRHRLGTRPEPASRLFDRLRLVKTPEEQDMLGRAGELVAKGIDVALEEARPGRTELEVKRLIENALFDRGAESADYVLVQSGPNSAAPHHSANETPLRAGQNMLVDIGARIDGYWGDTTQQVFLGDPPERYTRAYEVVRQAQEAGVQAARPGATAHDVASAASAVILESEFGEWNGPRTGHGVGLDIHEAPSVVEGNDTELVPGVVITVEPGVYIPGQFGIRIEDTILVTDGAPKRLTRAAGPLFAKAV